MRYQVFQAGRVRNRFWQQRFEHGVEEFNEPRERIDVTENAEFTSHGPVWRSRGDKPPPRPVPETQKGRFLFLSCQSADTMDVLLDQFEGCLDSGHGAGSSGHEDQDGYCYLTNSLEMLYVVRMSKLMLTLQQGNAELVGTGCTCLGTRGGCVIASYARAGSRCQRGAGRRV